MNRKTHMEQKLAEAIREIAVFCLCHRGRCFDGWPASTLFKYLTFHAFTQTLFVEKRDNHIVGVVIAWTASVEDILRRSENCEAHFDWKLPDEGKALMIAEVIGSRNVCHVLARRVLEKYPYIDRAFTHRHIAGRKAEGQRLIELTPKLFDRFCRKGAA